MKGVVFDEILGAGVIFGMAEILGEGCGIWEG